MSSSENPAAKSPSSHLHSMNLVVALLAGVISITGGLYSLKNTVFAGPAYGTLEGTVRDERIARPLRLVSIEVSDLTGAVVNTATSDDSGHYRVETLKTGNYAVKFTAPLHKVETKPIKIEKDVVSSINADLVPEASTPVLASVEPASSAAQNIPVSRSTASYTSPSANTSGYNTAQNTSAASGYSGAQNTPAASAGTSGYAQAGSSQDSGFSGPPSMGYRRHSRRSYSGDSSMASSGTSQSGSQSSAITQALPILQALLTKKSDSSSSTASS